MSTTSPTTSRTPSPPTDARPAGQPCAPSARAAARGRTALPPTRSGSASFAELLARAHDARDPRAPGGTQLSGGLVAPSHPGAAERRASPMAARDAAPTPDRDDAPPLRPHGGRLGDEDGDRSLLAAFLPPPAVLAAPLSATPPAAPAMSGAPARAEAAALAERLVRSMRVGKVGRDGHEVRLRLDVGARTDVEVRLRHVDGALSATLVADAASHADAERLAEAVRRELSARGVTCDALEVTLA